MRKIAADIKAKSFRPVYLVYGSEPLLIRRCVKALADALIPEDDRAMNMAVFAEPAAQPVIDALETLPFCSGRRVVLVKNAGLAERAEEAGRIAEYIPDILPESVLVIEEREIDKRSKLYKAAEKYGRAADCARPSEADVIKWIISEARKNGADIAPREAAVIARASQTMDGLAAEVAKLAAFAGGEITNEHINALCARPAEARIFGLTDALCERRPGKALEILEELLALREPPLMILSMIARQFRLMLHCSCLKGQGEAQIAEALGVKQYAARVFIRQSAAFTQLEMERGLRRCLEADLDVKTGRRGERLALEMLVAGTDGGAGQTEFASVL